MPFVRPSDMLSGTPLPGWSGRFLHSANMTFAHYDIAADAAPLHEHHHEQEEVWHVVDGEIALTIEGEEQVLTAGCVAVVPPENAAFGPALGRGPGHHRRLPVASQPARRDALRIATGPRPSRHVARSD